MSVDLPMARTALLPSHTLASTFTTRSASRLPLGCLALGLTLGLTLALPVHAADESAASRYRQDMRDCREGRTSQSRPDCEREARSAAAEARRGATNTTVDAAGQAQQRCAVFKQDPDRADCLARMGEGARLSGSVEGGGLLREYTRVVPAR